MQGIGSKDQWGPVIPSPGSVSPEACGRSQPSITHRLKQMSIYHQTYIQAAAELLAVYIHDDMRLKIQFDLGEIFCQPLFETQ